MKKLLVLLPLLALAACMGALPVGEPMSKGNLTSGQVSMTLRKNITTQAEVVEVFGAPNLVTQNADGEDVWTYQKNATVANATSNSSYATIILLGGSSKSSGFEQSSRTMTLIIKFKDIKGVKTVVDFSSRSSSF
jgi:outer membrane protein assembly factor BamE (lipoprotein component of BamABCDE complex)